MFEIFEIFENKIIILILLENNIIKNVNYL